MASDLLRISIMGGGPPGEVWSINPTFSLITAQDVSYADCAAIVTGINALSIATPLRTAMAGVSTVTGTRVEARTVGGTLQAQATGARGTPVTGTSPNVLPPQSAIVFSLRTPFPGASGRGRLYWPGTGIQLNSTGLRILGGTPEGLVTAFKSYMLGIEGVINSQLGGECTLAVWSRKNAARYAVNQIIVGDVVDTQRRRRDKLPEAYSATPYPV